MRTLRLHLMSKIFFRRYCVSEHSPCSFLGSGAHLYFDINVKSFGRKIWTLLLDAEAKEMFIEKALSLFGPVKADKKTICYRVHITKIKLFMLAIGIAGCGSSFKLKARQKQCDREELALN